MIVKLFPKEFLMGERNINWPAVFTAYANGAAPLDICREFLLAMPELEQRAKLEGWGRLREQLPVSAALSVSDFGLSNLQSVERLKANREANYEIVLRLRADLSRVVDDLIADKLVVVEFKTTKDGVHELERAVGIKDRAALAEYAERIFKMSYEALGDGAALGGASGDADSRVAGKNVFFQINMPSVASTPRPTRDRSGDTVDADEIKKP